MDGHHVAEVRLRGPSGPLGVTRATKVIETRA